MSAQLDYIGTRPCGCVPFWVSADLPARDIAKEVARAIRDGLNIERVTTEESRRRIGWCAVHRASRVSQESLAL